MLFTFLSASIIIRVIYGAEYLDSVIYLKIFSVLLISLPMISLHTTYYNSQEKTMLISSLLIASTVLNIGLNYILINIGIGYSMNYATIGACVATIISGYFYLLGLVFWRKKYNKA